MKEKIGVKVGDVMTRNFISASPNISVMDAAKILVKKHVGSLIIKEKGELKGILTEKDIIWALTKKSKKDLKDISVKDIMPKKVITIKPNTDLSTALKKMKRTKYRRLPVTIKKNVIGLLTIKDILRIEPALFDIAHQHFQILEESQKLERKKSPGQFKIGICEECGNPELVYNVDGALICESCNDAM